MLYCGNVIINPPEEAWREISEGKCEKPFAGILHDCDKHKDSGYEESFSEYLNECSSAEDMDEATKDFISNCDLPEDCAVFLNKYEFDEHYELMAKVMKHMVSDLSAITGFSEEEIMKDYIFKNRYNPVYEVFKRTKGISKGHVDKSMVLYELERLKRG